eukprot:3215805-Prymnesium_polylepis.1
MILDDLSESDLLHSTAFLHRDYKVAYCEAPSGFNSGPHVHVPIARSAHVGPRALSPPTCSQCRQTGGRLHHCCSALR